MRHMGIGLWLIVSTLVVNSARAGDAPSPTQRLNSIEKKVADADAAFRTAQKELSNPEDFDERVQTLYETLLHDEQVGIAAAIGIAKTEPKSAAGLDAMAWVLNQRPQDAEAIQLLADYQAANPSIGKTIALTSYYFPYPFQKSAFQALTTLDREVLEKNPDRTVRGQAALGLARRALHLSEVAMHQRQPDAQKLATDAIAAFDDVNRAYGDCPNLTKHGIPAATLAEVCQHELNELEHLSTGKPAPEITGTTVDGKTMTLSRYRGKVVVLDFWGDW